MNLKKPTQGELAFLIPMIESEYDPLLPQIGAAGLWQIPNMPAYYGVDLGLTKNW